MSRFADTSRTPRVKAVTHSDPLMGLGTALPSGAVSAHDRGTRGSDYVPRKRLSASLQRCRIRCRRGEMQGFGMTALASSQGMR